MRQSEDGLIRPSHCCSSLTSRRQWWIRRLPRPRNVEVANHYLVVGSDKRAYVGEDVALFKSIRESFGSFMDISRRIFTKGVDCNVPLRMTTLVRLNSKYARF